MPMGDRVRERRKAVGLSQAKLAKAVTALGIRLSQTQVAAIENGKVERPRCLPELARVLKTTPEYLTGSPQDGGQTNEIYGPRPLRDFTAEPMLPVWSVTYGGGRLNEWIVTNDPVGSTTRPRELRGAVKALAWRVGDDRMSPLCRTGDTVFADPAQPASPGDDCVLAKPISEDPQAYRLVVRHLVGETATTWKIRQFHPDKSYTVLKADWPQCWKFQGKYAR